MAQNPVRGHFVVVGTILQNAGIRTLKTGETLFMAEETNAMIPTSDPASMVWFSQRAVIGALKRLRGAELEAVIGSGNALDLKVATITPALVMALAMDPRAARRLTEDHIIHMLGDRMDEAAARAYAADQIQRLEAYYGTAAASKVA